MDMKFSNLCLLLLLIAPLILFAQSRGMRSVHQEQISEQRVALVIGNGAYRDAPLANPTKDAKAISSTLRTLGFTVIEKIDVPQEQLDTAVSNSVGMELVLVQPGTFLMGSDSGNADEKPIHSVTISKPFYIGKYEVTQKQWRDVMGENPRTYQGDNRPVYNESWIDARYFIQRLNGKERTTKYRLPTEAEWEFTARGGTQSNGYKFAGSNDMVDVSVELNKLREVIKPVRSRRPNELGLYDMSGSVWEWCSDWYGAYGDSAQRDPKGLSSGTYRALRGGYGYLNLRGRDFGIGRPVAERSSGLPGDIAGIRVSNIGIRCVRDP
jgi:formylglycine-generating enzyme required for sulfatase activity